MKRGDLVQLFFPAPLGIILRESRRTNRWGDRINRWWWILMSNGEITEEVETAMVPTECDLTRNYKK